MRSAWVDGRFLVEDEAGISPFDEGFRRGMGAFETLRSLGGLFPTLRLHLARLRWSCLRMGFTPSLAVEQAAEVAGELLGRAGLTEGVLRVTATRGAGGGPTHAMTVEALPPGMEALRQRGASVVVSPFRRDPCDPTAGLKGTAYAFHVLAREEAAGRGADEALLLSQDGWVQEGAFSNVFCRRDGTVLTPTLTGGFLPGVARGLLLRCLGQRGVPVREATLRPEDLLGAEAVWLTSAVWHLLPVGILQGRRIPGVADGLRIHGWFQAWLAAILP